MSSTILTADVCSFVTEYAARADCRELVLGVRGDKGATEVVDTYPAGGGISPSKLAERIVQSAELEAGDTRTRFVLVATAKGDRALGRRRFDIEPNGGPLSTTRELSLTGDFGGELFPTPYDDGGNSSMGKGSFKYLLKHNEAMTKLFVGSLMGLLGESVQQQRYTNERIRDVEGEYVKAMKVTQDLLDRQHDRDIETKRENAELDRRARMMERFESDLLPVLLSRMTGASEVGEFMNSLKPEQIAEILPNLTEKQVETLQALWKKGDEGDRAAARWANGGKDPEGDDATGASS
jgi:hypothetical protein